MPCVSADNQQITLDAQAIREHYKAFLSGMRGLSAEILAGLNNGTKSFIGMSRELKALADHHKHVMTGYVEMSLREAAQSALNASSRAGSADVADRALAVADSLVAGFERSVLEAMEAQMQGDIATAEGFLRKQLTQGRFFATTEELNTDLQFVHTDKSGRQINSDEFVFREANWALRQNYNSILLVGCSTVGLDQFVVDGGSKSGLSISLDDYDKYSGAIFHHNSKALLQPTHYSVS